MRRNIVLTIQYEGTRFDGWQKQGNTQNTIQGKLEAVLSKLTDESVELHASGRTDAGVHAFAQIANFHTDCNLSCDEIMRYVNQFLPKDCALIAAREAEPRFHSRLSAKRKRYRYTIHTSEIPDVFSRRFAWELGAKLDVSAMKTAAKSLIGRHDFKCFCDNKHMKKSTVRELYEINIVSTSQGISIDFLGNGFLYHMVRLIAGTLVSVGEGELTADELSKILESGERSGKVRLAPACGLCLMEVFYD